MKPISVQLKRALERILSSNSNTWNIFSYKPDLIVEVTDACDRTCHGCYAPNVLVRSRNVAQTSAIKFLTPLQLDSALSEMGDLDPGAIISFRGGEPTLSPHFGELIELANFRKCIPVFETHGRWILTENTIRRKIIDICKKTHPILKISADSMHAINHTQLKEMINAIKQNELSYIIAVTALSNEKLLEELNQLQVSPLEEIIFQPIATSSDELIKPTFGVIDKIGCIKDTLTDNFSAVVMER
jgi:organic radical activating enzyme